MSVRLKPCRFTEQNCRVRTDPSVLAVWQGTNYVPVRESVNQYAIVGRRFFSSMEHGINHGPLASELASAHVERPRPVRLPGAAFRASQRNPFRELQVPGMIPPNVSMLQGVMPAPLRAGLPGWPRAVERRGATAGGKRQAMSPQPARGTPARSGK